ncbi:NAD(+) diphosphatase [Afifella sp. IM 167]|uniref:NAD(+) diphosphatase n=1 Tax=Afifella sp. IM 167 TaxID=2033586 RepID=UPI001CCEAEE9|nr:NAD(+) diphosphatase [Afifella sp. IM 167]MBZ8133797.1 NAD(+) diphosphatase [Afifella sp. IM 167]
MNFFERPYAEMSGENAFAGNPIDRQAEHRSETSIAEALRAPAARIHLLAEDRPLIRFGSAPEATFTEREAEALGLARESLILLGFTPEGPRLAGNVAERETWPEPVKAVDLRSLAVQALLPAEELGALAQARSMLAWHQSHAFCARCGSKSEMRGGGARRECPACGAPHFPRVDPVVIMLAIDAAADACLLGRQPRFAPGVYSALAGFMEPGETMEAAVRREIQEEAGIDIGRVRYHSSQPWPFVSSLMIGCHAEALSSAVTPDESELEDCRWFSREEVGTMLAGTHPDGLAVPPRMAIANRLISEWAKGGS